MDEPPPRQPLNLTWENYKFLWIMLIIVLGFILIYIAYKLLECVRDRRWRRADPPNNRHNAEQQQDIELQQPHRPYMRPISAASAAPKYEEHESDVALHENVKLEIRDNRYYLARREAGNVRPPVYSATQSTGPDVV
ncbi:hypothetical protein FB567DRAFT_550550 [Paraphoma chrysanthemicola]|uniref:Uncharacterized protein n=1 Tax=Paraphoma chrysanthemicola TaxID=798071 RepID=A0A8K0R3V9_9PLEO|nr:hypothetical protein FB567DRAFT_550550 [Paraphoma chrysanthemicola]